MSKAARFGVAAALITAGCGLWMSGFTAGLLLFGLSTFFFLPNQSPTRPVPARELKQGLLLLFGIVLVSLAFAFIAWRLIPELTPETIRQALRHPAVVVPVWLFMMWGLRRHWRSQGTESSPR